MGLADDRHLLHTFDQLGWGFTKLVSNISKR